MNRPRHLAIPTIPAVPYTATIHPPYNSEICGKWFRMVEVKERTRIGIEQVERSFQQAGWDTWIRDIHKPRIVFVYPINAPNNKLKHDIPRPHKPTSLLFLRGIPCPLVLLGHSPGTKSAQPKRLFWIIRSIRSGVRRPNESMRASSPPKATIPSSLLRPLTALSDHGPMLLTSTPLMPSVPSCCWNRSNSNI